MRVLPHALEKRYQIIHLSDTGVGFLEAFMDVVKRWSTPPPEALDFYAELILEHAISIRLPPPLAGVDVEQL